MFKVQAITVKESNFNDVNGNPVKNYKVTFLTPEGDICYLNTKTAIKRGDNFNISYRTGKDFKPYLYIVGLS